MSGLVMAVGKNLCFKIGDNIYVKVYKEKRASGTKFRVRVISPQDLKVVRVKELFEDE